jgi:hypothetical protein
VTLAFADARGGDVGSGQRRREQLTAPGPRDGPGGRQPRLPGNRTAGRSPALLMNTVAFSEESSLPGR